MCIRDREFVARALEGEGKIGNEGKTMKIGAKFGSSESIIAVPFIVVSTCNGATPSSLLLTG